eukprot:5051518-Pyramimonas_sp.AAC.1
MGLRNSASRLPMRNIHPITSERATPELGSSSNSRYVGIDVRDVKCRERERDSLFAWRNLLRVQRVRI